MAFRTPTKHLADINKDNFVFRFVTHGSAIKYDSVEKTANNINLYATGAKSVSYLGLIDYKDLVEAKYRSVFAKKFLNNNPEYNYYLYSQANKMANYIPKDGTMSILVYRVNYRG